MQMTKSKGGGVAPQRAFNGIEVCREGPRVRGTRGPTENPGTFDFAIGIRSSRLAKRACNLKDEGRRERSRGDDVFGTEFGMYLIYLSYLHYLIFMAYLRYPEAMTGAKSWQIGI